MKPPKLVYIAGPYRASDAWEVTENIHRAERAAREVARLGAMPVTPHSITARMSGVESDELWLQGTLELMRRCDAVLVLPGYEKSGGTQGEIAEADRLQLPIFMPLELSETVNYYALEEWLAEPLIVTLVDGNA